MSLARRLQCLQCCIPTWIAALWQILEQPIRRDSHVQLQPSTRLGLTRMAACASFATRRYDYALNLPTPRAPYMHTTTTAVLARSSCTGVHYGSPGTSLTLASFGQRSGAQVSARFALCPRCAAEHPLCAVQGDTRMDHGAVEPTCCQLERHLIVLSREAMLPIPQSAPCALLRSESVYQTLEPVLENTCGMAPRLCASPRVGTADLLLLLNEQASRYLAAFCGTTLDILCTEHREMCISGELVPTVGHYTQSYTTYLVHS